ncbi:4-(cytidine 5'-diphospho)-2-C-methyl-D-erythritol kinase [Francisella adeliensis]|uniref:4-diphosphocytidyl-2-C-methyl-D-erythritol kinase n=2 Tax=Francisella adeliensis TaxID=2007306 RepID=A0A2Z4XWH8_9GAMM|nr:4-(cytidine 5'-diphospho)-2-C-methyl-D-erythritol kinase [Francisella adeliensis]AXA32978.1 4-(cytidine 5'-diphospho)-2-C-methyl-D-erythritol kinase [Francisella adeliensis]MBK2086137.1 4-(cytidine 5'-diphospho)-2-C-methyl-D-erythritol kinase [Francisella adeliensis]MBK2096699.1 4-(cytidine 5'-diphospho)-2-C-methyl-D-erythritol kinase [Francisella adeliensis]QIW11204.1 4-(cytidine 5'-diphospho)-2-C-methyl-D-erythritol kinase [Francisella adeliensis]QIW13080.1 4-(cytidine 5'-diphospho)-2-C-m
MNRKNMQEQAIYNSYAKINLFLHILNKRNDGYHNLQTWFTFVDLKDQLTFDFTSSDKISITSNVAISSKEDNLVYKAIRLFQAEYNLASVGVDVFVEKNIPMGAGLGGGSSNAATTLIAMRDYYRPNLANADMLHLGAKLGADVPIFLYGRSAWAEGIGDILHDKDFKEAYALLLKPDIHISTKEFFTSKELVKHTTLLSREASLDRTTMSNSFEQVFYSLYPEFKEYITSLDKNIIMTGTGSCFYLLSDDKTYLEEVATKIDKSLDKWIVKTLNYVY